MSGRIGLLSALLGVQLLIIAAVLFVESGAAGGNAGPWLEFDPAAVDAIHIADAEDQAVAIERDGETWQLEGGLPADAAKVDEVLERLAGLDAPFPVATSAAARERFEVTEDDHQRHVVLSAGGETVAEVYLGTSPGYQQVHARRAGDGDVFAVGLSNFQVPAAPDQWLDKTLLQARGEVQAVSRRGAWTLRQTGEGWQVSGAGEAAEATAAAEDAAADLLRRFSDLRVMGVAEAPSAAAPAAEFDVTDADGQYVLSLYEDADGSAYVVTSSRRDGHFELAGYLAEQMLIERPALLPQQDQEDDEASDEAADAAEPTSVGGAAARSQP
jgi:hypothetical protein